MEGKNSSLQSKALRLGMGAALLILFAMDLVFIVMQRGSVIGGWQTSHELVLEDWRRMCQQALDQGELSRIQSETPMVLRGPVELEGAYFAGPDGRILAHSDPKQRGRTLADWRGSLAPSGLIDIHASVRFSQGGAGEAGVLYQAPSGPALDRLVRDQRRHLLPGLVVV